MSSSRDDKPKAVKRRKVFAQVAHSCDETSDTDAAKRVVVPRRRSPRINKTRRTPSASLLRRLLSSILATLAPWILLITVVLFVLSQTTTWLSDLLSRFFSLLSWHPSSLTRRLHALQRAGQASLPVLTSVYCASIGLGCSQPHSGRGELAVGRTANNVRRHAEAALDIFGSILDVGQGDTLSHVNIWELSTAVTYMSELPDRNVLGAQLRQLGDLTRDVNDDVSLLNAKGVNALTWILHDFDRVESQLSRLSKGSTAVSPTQVGRLVDGLFSRLGRYLDDLLAHIDKAISKANEASAAGGTVMSDVASVYKGVLSEQEQIPYWKRVVDGRTFKSKQLARDVQIASESYQSVADLRNGLERARQHLLAYRDNAGMFKAGMIGFHMGAEDISAEDEMLAMSGVIQEVRNVVSQAKEQRGGAKQNSPPAAIEDR